MRTDSILKALDIDTDRYPVLSVVGGGGKTSLIFRMMEELTATGKKVLITTTTHMAYEPDRPFAEDGDMISIKNTDIRLLLHWTEKSIRSVHCRKKS